MISAALLLALVLSPGVNARVTENAAYSHRAFQKVLLGCPERVWPGLDWRELQFLFSEASHRNAWLISADGSAPEEIRKDQTIEDIFEPDFKFGFLDFRGRRTIAVNTENLSPQRSFRLAVHEFFKQVGQKNWHNPEYDDRGTLYPLLAEPRYFRRMAFDSLKSAYSEVAARRDPKAHLSAAAYWLRRWQKKYPEELPMQTDSMEGTALYVEQMAFIHAEAGCGVRGERFFTAYFDYLNEEMEISARARLVEEGLPMGAIASFLLTATQGAWFGKMNGTLMPADLVLRGVPVVRQGPNESILADYNYEVGRQQNRAQRRLRSYLGRENEAKYVRVSIPHNWQKGGLPVEEAYVLRERLGTTLLVLNENARFNEDHGSIHLPEHSVLAQSHDNPCGGLYHFLIPRGSITQKGTRFVASHGERSFSLTGGKKTLRGFTWICPRE